MNAYSESRDLDALSEDFQPLVKEVIQRCAARKVVMIPFYTLRGPGVQARLFCQSRTLKEVASEARRMQINGAPWLASLMKPEYALDHPQRDPSIDAAQKTNALPGASWHQWGKAIDCYVEAANKEAIWDSNHFGYEVYAEEAKRMGLEAGACWTMRDAVHVQATKSFSPISDGKLWPQIEATMTKTWRTNK